MAKLKKVLWVEDDEFLLNEFIEELKLSGIEGVPARSFQEGIEIVKQNHASIDCAVIDIKIPLSKNQMVPARICQLTHGGHQGGVGLAKWIHSEYSKIPVIGCSSPGRAGTEAIDWFLVEGDGYWEKGRDIYPGIAAKLLRETLAQTKQDRFRPFIVHGHDDSAIESLRDFLQNGVKIGNPIILREEASLGRTIYQKFEDLARRSSLVFILLTPDDVGSTVTHTKKKGYRARQNVILELGYFLGMLNRERRNVILLQKGKIEPPSDILGLIYIDITDGINDSAKESIRRELTAMRVLE